MKLKHKDTLLSVGLIFFIGVITYLPFLHLLGVYHDDWKLFTPFIAQTDFPALFSSDRPAIGYFYEFFVQLLGFSPYNWQVFSLFLNFAATLAFYTFCRLLFTGKNLLSTMMAVLFFIFPGFYQQSNAITYSTHFMPLFLGLLSIDLMLIAIKKRIAWVRILLIFIAVICQFLYLSLAEYFIGLEVVRLIALWIVVTRDNPSATATFRIKKTILYYLPYLAASFLFLYWRFFIFHATRTSVSPEVVFATLVSHPLSYLFNLGVDLFRNFLSGAASAWSVPVTSSFAGLANEDILKSLLLALAAALVVFFGIRYLERREENRNPVGKILILSGALIILFCLFPIVLAGRDIMFSSGFDRYTAPALIGSIFVIGGLVSYAKPFVFKLCFTALVFISTLTQVNMQLKAANYWQAHKDFWWQLSWRVPDLQNGTVLIPVLAGDSAFWDIWEIFVPANLIYRADDHQTAILSEILNNNNYRGIREKRTFEVTHRSLAFTKDYSKALIMGMPIRNSCLQILDSRQPELSSSMGALVEVVASSSNNIQIQATANPKLLPENIFGSEPPREWCYFYEKASLARQKGDWVEVVRLADEANLKGYQPVDRTEWMPFLEGFLNTGRLSDAEQLIEVIRNDVPVRIALCDSLSGKPNGAYSSRQVFTDMVTSICDQSSSK